MPAFREFETTEELRRAFMADWGPWRIVDEHDLGDPHRVTAECRRLEVKDDFATVKWRVVRHWKPEGERIVHCTAVDRQEVYDANCRILNRILGAGATEALRKVPGFGRFA